LLLASCALFSASTPHVVIFLVLLASGMVRSPLLSALNTLVFVDVPKNDVGSATIIWNIVLQGTNALGVSASAILLAVSAQLTGEGPGQLALHDFRLALLIIAAIGMCSLFWLRRLPRDAGSHVSGHHY
jgi:sugar phosphate permease